MALSPRTQRTEEPGEEARGHPGEGQWCVNAALGILGVLPSQHFDPLATVFKGSFLNRNPERLNCWCYPGCESPLSETPKGGSFAVQHKLYSMVLSIIKSGHMKNKIIIQWPENGEAEHILVLAWGGEVVDPRG